MIGFCVSSAVSMRKTVNRANTFGKLIEKFSLVSQKGKFLFRRKLRGFLSGREKRFDNDRLSLSIRYVYIRFRRFFRPEAVGRGEKFQTRISALQRRVQS